MEGTAVVPIGRHPLRAHHQHGGVARGEIVDRPVGCGSQPVADEALTTSAFSLTTSDADWRTLGRLESKTPAQGLSLPMILSTSIMAAAEPAPTVVVVDAEGTRPLVR